jgi:hypothetical protein
MRGRKKLQITRPTRGVCTTCRASFLAPTVDEARKLLLEHWAETGHPTGTVNRKPVEPPPFPKIDPKSIDVEEDDAAALAAGGYDNYGVLDDAGD